MGDLADLYQQTIVEHNRSPRNFRALPDPDRTAQGQNPLCGDNVTVFLKFDGDRIGEITFQGSGCAISKASASILTESLRGLRRDEVKPLFDRIHQMVTTGQTGTGDLGKLAVFAGVHRFPARVKCAILPWHAVMAALKGDAKPVTTESEEN